MHSRKVSKLPPAALWVVVCVLCNAAGWTLSAIGQLNATGYLAVFALAGVAAVAWFRKHPARLDFGWRTRRFKNILPLAFAVVAALTLLGGLIHPPANYDALAYRTPRVLHWLAENRWHWIHTDFQRVNTRGCGIEWMTAPLIALTRTDRLFFLFNAVSFLLLPGLCFRVLTGLGVRSRVAWHWMWILPCGYCYVLQGGSIANDLFGATLALIALDFALAASKEKSVPKAWIAILAAALMTASKGFNLLLLLPFGLAMLPTTWMLLKRPLSTFSVGLVALLVSLLPSSLLNIRYCGDWKGINAEPVHLCAGYPIEHLAVNTVVTVIQNFTPTVFPVAGAWNRTTNILLPDDWRNFFKKSFEGGGNPFQTAELPMEEAAGLGMGCSILLASVLIASPRYRSKRPESNCNRLLRPGFLVPTATFLVTAYFFTQSGLGCPSRYLSPVYVILSVPLLRLHSASVLVRKTWWRKTAVAMSVITAGLVIITPPRPMWPAQSLLKAIGADQSVSFVLNRIWNVYSVYGNRADGFAPVRSFLPPETKNLGFVTFDDPETSLWRPFGSIRIHHVTRSDAAVDLRQKGIELVLVSDYILTQHDNTNLAAWLRKCDAELLQSFDLTLRATRGPTRWHLARVRPQATSATDSSR
jgi:hypothetical protein